ncbi:MAG: autotransporter domain-containing protein [Akkermansia sp.]|nr:autotransporter domain-containing protein [Akkermansia sp.]
MKLRIPQQLLAAVMASLTVISAYSADFSVGSADELITAWNQAARSNDNSTITITAPSQGTFTLTNEQKNQLQAITGTGKITLRMSSPTGALENFNYTLVNEQVSFVDITLAEPLNSTNDIVISHAGNATIQGKNISVLSSETTNNLDASINDTNGRVILGNNTNMGQNITINAQASTNTTPMPAPADSPYTRTSTTSFTQDGMGVLILGTNTTLQAATVTGQIVSNADAEITLNGDISSTAAIGSITTEEFDSTGTQTSKVITDSPSNTLTGGIRLGKVTAGDITISSTGGDISLGTGSQLNGTTITSTNATLRKTSYSNDDGNWSTIIGTPETIDTLYSNISIGDNSNITGNARLNSANNITLGKNTSITGNSTTTGVITAAGNIHIGANSQISDNSTNTENTAVINIAEYQTLHLGAGSILTNNTANNTPASIVAAPNSQIIITGTGDTYINDGILTTSPQGDAQAATLTQASTGTLYYGGPNASDNFGGNYKQITGNLSIGHTTFSPTSSASTPTATTPINGAVMGTDTTSYNIESGTVTINTNSTLRGESASFADGTELVLADGATLDLATPAELGKNMNVRALITDAEGNAIAPSRLPKGTASITVTLNNTDISNNLLNTPFIATSLSAGSTNGTTQISQTMRGIDTPLRHYTGNVYTVAHSMEQNRLEVSPNSAAAQFYDTILNSKNTEQAANLIQSASGENIVNFTWAANSTLKGFTDLGRLQGLATINRNNETCVTVVDAKGSPIATKKIADGKGSIWVGGFGVWDNQSSSRGISGYEYNAGGYAIGSDYHSDTGTLMGMAIGQSFGSIKDKKGWGSNYDVDSFMAMLYGGIAPTESRPFGIDGYVAYGRSKFKGNSYLMGSALNGNVSANTFSAALYATWADKYEFGKMNVTPFTGIEFSTSELNSLTEEGTLGRNFRHARAQNWTIPVGITIARPYQTASGMFITPNITLAVTQDVARINPSSRVSGPLGEWNARGANPGRTAFRMNAGVDIQFNDNWAARLSYLYETRSNFSAHGLNGTLSYSF